MRVVSIHKWLYGSEDVTCMCDRSIGNFLCSLVLTWTAKSGYGFYHNVWTMVETWLGIIIACVPILQKQFRAQGVLGSKIYAGWVKVRSMSTVKLPSTFSASPSSSGASSNAVSTEKQYSQNIRSTTVITVSKSYAEKELSDTYGEETMSERRPSDLP